jgi:hypothetical protein
MIEYLRNPAVSKPDYASLHPTLAALEVAINEQNTLVQNADNASRMVQSVTGELDAPRLIQQIEEAHDKPEELAKLRLKYDERAIGYMRYWLDWENARSKMMAGRSRISAAIVDGLKALDEAVGKGGDRSTFPFFIARLVVASESHCRDIGDGEKDRPYNARSKPKWMDVHPNFLLSLQKIQANAFRAMVKSFPKTSAKELYSTLPNERATVGGATAVFNLRNVDTVEFVDCVNSMHPASATLYELSTRVRNGFNTCHNEARVMAQWQNGRINERQHAARVIEFLQSDGTEEGTKSSGANLTQQINAQNERRLDYEVNRMVLGATIQAQRILLISIVDALKASAVETEELLKEVESDRRATIDRLMTVRIMMNNCLSIDCQMRQWVATLNALQSSFENDLSDRSGARCLKESFDKLRLRYATLS